MCGILAILGNVPFDDSIVLKALNALKARGPESYHFHKIDKTNVTFHFQRLAINCVEGIEGNQPFNNNNNITWMCNGEIYNSQELSNSINIKNNSSDCYIIGDIYEKFGIERCIQMLDGVFGLAICDTNGSYPIAYFARDPYGVRPLHYISGDGWAIFASDVKTLTPFAQIDNNIIMAVPPGTYISPICLNGKWFVGKYEYYHRIRYDPNILINKNIEKEHIDYMIKNMIDKFTNAILKRVNTLERPVAALLSGGLDSSVVAALVAKMYPKQLKTFCIGMPNSTDSNYAQIVAEHIKSNHINIVLTTDDFFDAIPEVISSIESYDTTTVRASVGNYLVSKYISNTTDAKVVFNGDGSDELTGGYIYTANAPSDIEFDNDCRRLLENISCFDVLRSDRSISSNGLEARTPFLDRTFVDSYMAIPVFLRNHKSKSSESNNYWNMVEEELVKSGKYEIAEQIRKRPEKLLFRYALYKWLPGLLPDEILWRTKEAFSDGVSSEGLSWFQIIKDKLENRDVPEFIECYDCHNAPMTKEQRYYRNIFNSLYPTAQKTIPYFWMPKWSNTLDPSARTLQNYKQT